MSRFTNMKNIYISDIQKRMFMLSFVTSFFAAFALTSAVLIDNLIICAFFGEAEIAAVALASPFFYLLEVPAAGLAAGLQTVCAKETGAGQIDRINRQFSQIFFIAAVILAVLLYSPYSAHLKWLFFSEREEIQPSFSHTQLNISAGYRLRSCPMCCFASYRPS